MHRSLTPFIVAIAFTFVALPSSARAEPPAQPAPAGAWSIGAGVTFGGTSGLGGLLGPGAGSLGGASVTPARLVTPQLSLERRAGERTSVLLGISGSFSEQNTGPESSTGTPRPEVLSRAGSAALSLGARYAFVEGPATVSGYALLSGGYSAVSETGEVATTASPTGLLPYDYQADIFGGGLELGLSVERRFTEVFAVRISTSLGRIDYSNGYAKLEVGEGALFAESTGVTSGFQTTLAITPTLEARLYF